MAPPESLPCLSVFHVSQCIEQLFLPAGLAPSLKLGPDFSHLCLSPLLVFSLVQLLISFMSVETLRLRPRPSAFLADRPRISA